MQTIQYDNHMARVGNCSAENCKGHSEAVIASAAWQCLFHRGAHSICISLVKRGRGP